MPHILRDVNPIVATLLTQHHIFYDRTIIIVSSHSNLASQDNERLILRWLPMDGYHSPWLHRIQKPMALILQRLMEVLVHAQTGRCPPRNPYSKISSGPMGSYPPSFASIIAVPLSMARTVCHWPIGIFSAT